MKTYYELECNGKIFKGIGHSFTKWGLLVLSMFFNYPTCTATYSQTVTIKSTAGSNINIPRAAPLEQNSFGMTHSCYITQGTSNTPFDWEQHNMISPVTLTTVSDYTPVQTVATTPPLHVTVKLETLRVNATTSDIIIREIGLIGSIRDTGGATRNFLICRDVLEEPITMPPDANIRIRYFFRLES